MLKKIIQFLRKLEKSKENKFQDYFDFFKEETLNELLESEGYVTINVLGQKEINDLQEKIEFETPLFKMAEEIGYIEGVCISDVDVRKNLDRSIRDIVTLALDKKMHNYKSILFTAIVKDTNLKSNIDLHQDWSLTDERKYPSLTLWMPLIDSNELNGTICLVPKSHKKFNNIRGGNIPFIFSEKEKQMLLKQMTPINVKAGEIVIFNQRVVHYSPPNLSTEKRIAVLGSILPNEAVTANFFQNEDEVIEMYKMNDDFFLDFNDFIKEKNLEPKGEKIDEYFSRP